jgi:hypothetical protein
MINEPDVSQRIRSELDGAYRASQNDAGASIATIAPDGPTVPGAGPAVATVRSRFAAIARAVRIGAGAASVAEIGVASIGRSVRVQTSRIGRSIAFSEPSCVDIDAPVGAADRGIGGRPGRLIDAQNGIATGAQ